MKIKFITLDNAWKRSNAYNSSFKLNWFQRLKQKLSKKNITRIICTINVAIPMTAWPVTNPIIIKISKKLDKDKLSRKVNVIKMRFM